jgi:hypothetical protein
MQVGEDLVRDPDIERTYDNVAQKISYRSSTASNSRQSEQVQVGGGSGDDRRGDVIPARTIEYITQYIIAGDGRGYLEIAIAVWSPLPKTSPIGTAKCAARTRTTGVGPIRPNAWPMHSVVTGK